MVKPDPVTELSATINELGNAMADMAQRLGARIGTLEAVIVKAVAEIRSEHRPMPATEVGRSGGCVICWPKDGSWPCTTALVADEMEAYR